MQPTKRKAGRPVGSKNNALWVTRVVQSSNKSVASALTNPDLVNQPPHYKVGGIETIDFIEAKKLGYNLGNVVKYVSRAEHKADRVQDLRKAKWYLEREIDLLSGAK